ncbi:MAG: V-type ATP synthase subunit I, partial [Verrucomicrobia bacterium]|nr:V-type ATP synthase subunit I [Verrucomicrobiota bacterium]
SPSTNDRDPSRWVLWFFAFFFAIIVGDAGYGLILLLTSLWLQYKFGKKAKGFPKRFLKLCLILSSSALIWGMLTNSFFGIEIAPENPLRKISITNWLVREKVAYVLEHPDSANYKEWVAKYPQLENDQTVDGWLQGASKTREGTIVYDLLTRFSSSVMIELAVMIGVIHLILAFCRMIDRNWAGIGWILFMVGSYLYFPSILKATSIIHFLFHVPEAAGAEVGLQLLFCGIGLAVVLSLIQNRLKGLFEIANVIQIFSDSLSYLRLYALALAGGMMGATFNEIGATAGYFFGAIIIVIGHLVDLTLAIMGGIIHGLRLNFLEWYRHCFEGGGKMLQPLKLIEK